MEGKKTSRIEIKVAEDLKKQLEEVAEKENRSVSNLIETVLKGYVELKLWGRVMIGTDWNAELDLAARYVNWLVTTNSLPCFSRIHINLSALAGNPERILQLFMETGVLFVNTTNEPAAIEFHAPSFEEWRENEDQVNLKFMPAPLVQNSEYLNYSGCL